MVLEHAWGKKHDECCDEQADLEENAAIDGGIEAVCRGQKAHRVAFERAPDKVACQTQAADKLERRQTRSTQGSTRGSLVDGRVRIGTPLLCNCAASVLDPLAGLLCLHCTLPRFPLFANDDTTSVTCEILWAIPREGPKNRRTPVLRSPAAVSAYAVLRAYSTVNCVVAAMGEMVPSAVMARTVNSYSPGSAI